MSSIGSSDKVTLKTLETIKRKGERFACITAYDAAFAEIASSAGVEVLLVGDSLGMVVQGHDSTLPVTMQDILYHLETVRRGNRGSPARCAFPSRCTPSGGLPRE